MKSALRASKRWADFYAIVSVGLVIALMGCASYLISLENVDASTQIATYLTMLGVIIVVCIWQAAAFAAATVVAAMSEPANSRPPVAR